MWANHCLIFHTDNLALVYVLSTHTSRDSQIMILLRCIICQCLRHNILFRAEHVPDKHNILADLLSRLQVTQFHALAPWADYKATPVSARLRLSVLLAN